MALSKQTLKELEGYTIISPEQKKHVKKVNKRRLDNEQFVRVKESFNEVTSYLTLEQNGLLMYLLQFAKFDTEGQLIYNSKRMTISDVAKLVGKSERQTRTVIGELETLSLLTRDKVGRNVYLSLGESFFNCGYSEEKFKFVKLYKTRLKEIASQLTLSELGFLMKLLPHFHWKTHLLVNDANEMELSNLTVWQRKHIAEELDVSIDFIKRAIPKLRKVRAIVEVKSAKTGIVLEPSLVCRQEFKPTFEEVVATINEGGLTKDNFRK